MEFVFSRRFAIERARASLDDLQQTLDKFAVPQAEQAEIKAIVASTLGLICHFESGGKVIDSLKSVIGRRQNLGSATAALHEGAQASSSLSRVPGIEQSSPKTDDGICVARLTPQLIKSTLNLRLTFHVQGQRLNAEFLVDPLKF
jgi:hypothetical protein